MAYEEAKDKFLGGLEVETSENNKIVLRAYSYDGGDTKFQLGREYYSEKKDTTYNQKLGRVTAEEMDYIAEMYNQLSKELSKTTSGKKKERKTLKKKSRK